MNKPSGTFWCNHCDDNAFSETCWRCHRAATFIPCTTGTMATAPAPASTIVRYVTPPAEWFRRMRAQVAGRPGQSLKAEAGLPGRSSGAKDGIKS